MSGRPRKTACKVAIMRAHKAPCGDGRPGVYVANSLKCTVNRLTNFSSSSRTAPQMRKFQATFSLGLTSVSGGRSTSTAMHNSPAEAHGAAKMLPNFLFIIIIHPEALQPRPHATQPTPTHAFETSSSHDPSRQFKISAGRATFKTYNQFRPHALV